ncbi:fatty acid desaturase [Pseudomonadales bacterium]|nr:fatty acid desaturase [Pseudomonadales bacterium]MDA8880544.1 fatty acid desaturase [Pseudomonadales bacterium]
MFRKTADRLPVFLILSLTLVDFILYFTVENFWVLAFYFALTVVPKGCICSWNHHHQHTKTFRFTPLNRLLELVYALHTGVTTNLWLLHHVFGHHHNYLDQTIDESRWKRKDGTLMSEWEYTLNVAFTAYYRGYLVGKKHPHHYRTHVIYTALAVALVLALTIYHPLQATMLFTIPMVVGLFITAWVTYDHHAGLSETEDHFKASFNNINPVFNLVTGNLGYHTAHHYRQGVHWSELPALHDKIKDEIPREMYKTSFWEVFNNSFFLKLFGLSR